MSTAITTSAEVVNPLPQEARLAPAPQNETATVINLIVRAASDPAVSIDKMERLFAMQKEMIAEQKRDAYQAAMALAQAEIGPVARDRQNAHTKSTYATLEAVDTAIRPLYTKHGFSLTFDAEQHDDGRVTIICDVLHAQGHRERKTLKGNLDTVGTNGTRNKTDIQGLGSSSTYLRRYLTCMVFNVAIANEDKDGNRERAAGATISAAQYKQLSRWLDEVDGDPDKFIADYKIASLVVLPVARFEHAVRRIQDRARSLGVTLSEVAADAS